MGKSTDFYAIRKRMEKHMYPASPCKRRKATPQNSQSQPSAERLILPSWRHHKLLRKEHSPHRNTRPLPPLAPETRIGGMKGTEQRNRPMGGMARIPLAPNASRSKEHLGAEYLISIPHRPPARTERHASLCARSLSRRAFASGNTQRYPIFYARFFAI